MPETNDPKETLKRTLIIIQTVMLSIGLVYLVVDRMIVPQINSAFERRITSLEEGQKYIKETLEEERGMLQDIRRMIESHIEKSK